MSENIFADAKPEGDVIENALNNIEDKSNAEKTAPESQPETKQVEEPSAEGEKNTLPENIPFHKHPRWIAQKRKEKELEARLAEFEKKFADVEPLLKQPQQERLPDWWARRYGETEDSVKAYREYQENTNQERERIKEEVVNAIKAEQENEKVEEKTAKEVIDSQLEEMKDEGLDFETPELMKFIIDFQKEYGSGSLLDAEGNYDLRKSLTLMQKLQPKAEDNSTKIKKQVASNLMKSKVSPASDTKIPVVNSNALRRGNWRDAI